jgi:predicted nucleic acid-binding Zn ribbon protein
MPKVCPECNTPIIGRSDKKFCSDQCRYLFNNRLKTDKEKEIIRINSILRKNRTILKRLNPIGKTTVRKNILEAEKFDFNYYTHTYLTSTGEKYYFCYEYGYHLMVNEKVLVVNWQPYMNSK